MVVSIAAINTRDLLINCLYVFVSVVLIIFTKLFLSIRNRDYKVAM